MKSPRVFNCISPETTSGFLLFFIAVGVSLFYAEGPGLGDDIGYWGLAMDLHQKGGGAWDPRSFHDLRWPVWGLIWLLQIPLGFTVASYYLQPAIYFGAGVVLIFFIAGRLGLPFALRWCAGIVFILHPLLDASISRPMPDLSEGFWVALSFSTWLVTMESGTNAKRVAWAAVTGLALACAQANRITGVFAIPILIAGTLFCYPRKIGWLFLCGLFALFFISVESAIYHHFTGDWLQSLHANLNARGRKGTEPIALWQFPFRFFWLLWKQPINIFTTLLALTGAGFVLWRGNRTSRALVVYFLVYYLVFNCAVQSFSPPRPLVRDGARFLASMAFPMSLLAPFSFIFLGMCFNKLKRGATLVSYIQKNAAIAIVALAVVLAILSNREREKEHYLAEISNFLGSVPDGTRVFSHDVMRYICQLADSKKSQVIHWTLAESILSPTSNDINLLKQCEQIWIVRKSAWVSSRKHSEMGREQFLPQLAAYLTPPLTGWAIESVIHKEGVPEFLFLSRGMPPLPSMEGRQLFENLMGGPGLPRRWTLLGKTITAESDRMPVPESLQGKNIFLGLRYASDRTEPLRVGMEFFDEKGAHLSWVLFKPYFFPSESPDFFAFHIPAGAKTVSFISKVEQRATNLELRSFDILVQ